MRPPRAAVLPFAALLAALPACSPQAAREAPGTTVSLSPVVRERLAAIEGEIAAPAPLGALTDEQREEVRGLVEMLAGSQGRMREVPVAAVREELGPGAIPALASELTNSARSAEERVAAAELLAALDDPRAAEPLAEALEMAPEPWLRQWCAYHLAATTQDWLVPRLIRRLKVETDHGTFVWLAATLARFDNFSGLDALFDLVARGATEEVRTQAQGQLAAIAERLERPIEEVRELWDSVDADQLPQPEPTPRLRRAAWELVAQLSSEHFQLRGVDDSRYVLSKLGPWAAAEIAAALGDEDAHVRLHTAQVLERMGPRARVAGPLLVRALDEPRLAAAAAESLGGVGYPPALGPLLAATGAARAHDLRVAAARALGRLGLGEALPRVQELFDDAAAPADLRLAAGTSLVLLEDGDRAARWLAAELAGENDPAGAERALETWLARGAERDRAGFPAALAAWNGEAGPPGVVPSLEQTRARWTRRAAALGAAIETLLTE